MEAMRASIERYLDAEDVELDDLELAGRTLRVTVDSSTGLDLDRISEVSRGVSRLLDGNDDFLSGRYNLEVTSPGLERKLRLPRHYEKSVGRDVIVKGRDGSKVRGRLVDANAEGFRIAVDGEERSMLYRDVSSARTVFTMPAKPKPGKQKKTKQPGASK